ncbi:obscurin-like [Misgurnus anguillicaudatus]|uniref:obscurin-like n=1 Tax=Misgurnus anguillicaudatus TaxID=75329 RepID=UPI003CCF14EA
MELISLPLVLLLISNIHSSSEALPKITVSVTPEGPVFIGETVDLKCEINQYSDWRYLWMKDTTEVKNSGHYTVYRDSLTINRVTQYDQKFRCKAERVGRPQTTVSSSAVNLNVKALPRATVRVTPDRPVFIGETVTLKCEIDQYRSLNWRYQWRKGTQRYTVNSDSLTINRVTESDQGRISCSAEIHGRPKTSLSSSAVDLNVKALPKATVKVPDSPVFTGETVTLKCEIGHYSNWRYVWYKGRTGTSVFEGNSYTIRSPSDQDEFWCRGKRDGRPSSSQDSNHVTLSVKALPRATVRVTADGPLFTGETVTLKCEIENQHRSLNWRYRWYKGRTEVLNSGRYTVNRDSLTINKVTESDQEEISCSADIHGRTQTLLSSSSVYLNVKALPRVRVRVTPDSPVFTEETVTLKCEIEDQYRSLNWRYLWYKGRTVVLNSGRYTVNRDSLTITGVTESDQDEFSCSAEIHGRLKTSNFAVHLTVNALPRATVRVTPDRSVFTGEKVTLKCEIEDQYSDWRYKWYKGRTETSVSEGNIYTIRSPSDQDEFWCRGERVGRPSSSQYSDHVTLSVKAIPRATVRVTPKSPLIIGETVTLKCEIEDQYSNWTYLWSKNTTEVLNFENYTVNRDSLTITGVTQSDQDEFRCRAEIHGRPKTSLSSSSVHLTVKERPTPQVFVWPDDLVFRGETANLRCVINRGVVSSWQYSWNKDSSLYHISDLQNYTIRSVTESDAGKYTCKGNETNGSQYSDISDAVTLTVSALPKITVRLTPDRYVFTGETVTLTCEIEDQYRSLNWRYLWYKGTAEVLNYKHYTVNRDSLTINGVTGSDQDEFSCSADIHGRPQTSLSSSAVYLNVYALPRATVNVTSDRSVFTGETVTLKCEIEDKYSDWRYMWYKGRPGTSVFEGNIYTISSPSDQDEFWCRGERDGRPSSSQYSDHVTLSVKALPRATVRVIPDRSVFTGETVTLKCEIEDQYSNWTYQWFKDTTGTSVFEGNIYTIRSPSDQDKFRCRGERDGRPSSSQYSNHVTLSVKALPRATVSVTPYSPVIIGETVTLKCEIENQYRSLNWRYVWYKNTTAVLNFENYTVKGDSITIIGVTESDQDEFRCSAVIHGRLKTSLSSSSVHLTVKERPTPQVSVRPGEDVYRGTTVNLTCVINIGGVSSWQYSWYKDSIIQQNKLQRYTIRSVTESDTGNYTCRGHDINGLRYSHISDAVTLTVSGASHVEMFGFNMITFLLATSLSIFVSDSFQML